MPLVAFKPTKARLVIEQGRESVLVMQVVVAKGETVALAVGGRLEAITGFLRIRERKEERGRNENKAVGSIVFVPAVGDGDERTSAEFPDQHLDVRGEVRGAAQGRDFRAAAVQVLRQRRRPRFGARPARHGLRDPRRRADQVLGQQEAIGRCR